MLTCHNRRLTLQAWMGYALGSMATVGARYDLRAGEASAGHRFDGTLSPHEAVRIFTGAPVPNGVARVVLQEDVTLQDGQILIGNTLDLGPHIRPCGQDFVKGQSFAPKWLSASDLALLAAMNVPTITLAQRPKVAIIATGDELVMPGERPNSDQIIASNIFALKALAEAAGGHRAHLAHCARHCGRFASRVRACANGRCDRNNRRSIGWRS